MYSLDPQRNGEIRAILRDTALEEMLHMVLAANVLNALGGSPSIDRPNFVPKYPGHLPGGVEGHVAVHLRPFSMDQLRVFIEIEEPRDPLEGTLADDLEVGTCTIGEFYLSIEWAIAQLEESVFSGDPAKQVGPELMRGSVAVTDQASAIRALATIIDQGEGARRTPMGAGDGEAPPLAHYYRFMQIHEGRRLVNAEGSVVFAGEPIEFDPEGVWTMPDDPSVHHFAKSSTERHQLEGFNTSYRALLGSVERFLNGAADDATFMRALASMKELEERAEALVRVGLGPTFELV
jgi:hypothetical protein